MQGKTLICVDLKDQSINLMKKKLESILKDHKGEVHFVHAFELQVYADAFFYATYPTEDQYQVVEDSVKKVLGDLVAHFKTLFPQTHFISQCLIVSSVKEAVVGYA